MRLVSEARVVEEHGHQDPSIGFLFGKLPLSEDAQRPGNYVFP